MLAEELTVVRKEEPRRAADPREAGLEPRDEDDRPHRLAYISAEESYLRADYSELPKRGMRVERFSEGAAERLRGDRAHAYHSGDGDCEHADVEAYLDAEARYRADERVGKLVCVVREGAAAECDGEGYADEGQDERDRHKPAYDEVEVRQLLMHGREMTLLHRIVILAPVADRDDGDKRRDARRDSFNAARERRDKEPVNQLAPVDAGDEDDRDEDEQHQDYEEFADVLDETHCFIVFAVHP